MFKVGDEVEQVSKTKTKEWVKVGELPVDAGCLMIVDPSYIVPVAGSDWYDDQVVGRLDESKGTGVQGMNPMKNNAYGDLGLVVSSGLGDGCYPVYVRYEECYGRRVAEVRIDFLLDDEDENAGKDLFDTLAGA